MKYLILFSLLVSMSAKADLTTFFLGGTEFPDSMKNPKSDETPDQVDVQEESNKKEDEANQRLYQMEQDTRNSLEGIMRLICDQDSIIILQERAIHRQKEITKISGVVNLSALNAASARIVDARQMKQDAIARYKVQTKRELKEYSCQF